MTPAEDMNKKVNDMDTNDPNQMLVIKNTPVVAWIISAFFALAAIFIFSQSASALVPALIFFGIALLVLVAFGGISTVRADRFQRVVSISHRTLIGKKEKTYSFNDVDRFEVEASRSRVTHQHRTIEHRVVMVLKNGEKVPLENVYTNNYNQKAMRARQLSEFLNLPAWENIPQNQLQHAINIESAMTARPEQAQSGTTDGINWTINIFNISGKVVTRWVCTNFNWPECFLLLSQKPKSAAQLSSGGFLGNLALLAFQQIMGIYGFKPADTPYFEDAAPLNLADPNLAQVFSAFTNGQTRAQQLVNARVAAVLMRWAEHHPLKTVSKTGEQMAILYSPNGLMVSVLGSSSSQQTEEIIAIGAELMKALDSQP
jgi:hypothetical protein